MTISENAAPLAGAQPPVLDRPRTRPAPPLGGRGEYVCDGCGYGIHRSRPPQRCPMCQSDDWRPVRPFHDGTPDL